MASANRGTGSGQRHVQEDFSQQATYFLQSFIVESFERERVVNAPTLTEIRAEEQVELEERTVVQFHESWSEVGMTFRRIADTIDQGEDFQRVVADIPKDPSIDEIMCYVRDIFSDGEINWGRIVALFYFAYKVCVKKFESYMERTFPAWVNKLVYALVKFLVLKFADWIINRGGWKSIQEYFGTADIIWKGLVILSLLTLGLGRHDDNGMCPFVTDSPAPCSVSLTSENAVTVEALHQHRHSSEHFVCSTIRPLSGHRSRSFISVFLVEEDGSPTENFVSLI